MDKGNIYKITNIVNGKIYIGCTIHSLKRRFSEHLYRCEKTDINTKLYNSIRKYGIESFKIELIEECDLNVIYETEKKYIELYDTFNNGLNSTFGGEGCLGYTHSSEIRKKISEIIKDGRSHKGKCYEDIYGKDCDEQKKYRSDAVTKYWENISEEDKKIRLENFKNGINKNRKYSKEIMVNIKNKLDSGIKVKEIIKEFPDISEGYLYALKNNRRGKTLN